MSKLPIEKQTFTWSAIVKLAEEMGVEPAALWSVAQVESDGGGFNPVGKRSPISPKLKIDTTGLPVIRFEGHQFWRECEKRRINPQKLLVREDIRKLLGDVSDIVYRKADKKKSKGFAAGYDSLSRARQINEDAALCSCSWGFGQVMGYHYAKLGWQSIQDFVADMSESFDGQAKAFVAYIKKFELVVALQRKDWAAFALGYNGPGYKENKYDYRMAQEYMKAKARAVK